MAAFGGFLKTRLLDDRTSDFPGNSHVFRRSMSFSAAGWQRIREAREREHNDSGTRIGLGQAFFGVGGVDFLPAEIFLTTLHVRFSSRVKKDLGGYGARKENKPTRYRAASII